MLNLLTIDLEDYFQVHAFSKVIRYEDWDKFECRIERNTDRLLSILNDSPAHHRGTSLLDNSSLHSLVNPSSDVSKPQHRSTAGPDNSITYSPNNSLTQGVKATFFILGWIAERYPDLVRRIQKEGHEIACHGYAHRLVYTQSRDEFRQDIKRAKSILQDITGKEVVGYRAPSYSITKRSQWAFEVLAEEGFKYDSSIFPIRHDFYGIPEAPRFPFVISLNGNDNCEFSMLNFELKAAAPQHRTAATPNNSSVNSLISPSFNFSERQHRSTAARNKSFTQSATNAGSNNSEIDPQHSTFNIDNSKLNIQNSQFIIEFPLSTVKVLGTNFPISGGGYFRLFPYLLIRKGLRGINDKEGKPFIFYIHPWEIDPDQPRVNGLSSRSRFRHYVNLNRTEFKLKKLLTDFYFSSVEELPKGNASSGTLYDSLT